MKVRKAQAQELQIIVSQYEALLTSEEEHGTYSNWVRGIYPLPSTAQKAYDAGSLFVLEDNGEIVGSMVLNQKQAPEYREVPWHWNFRPEEILVVHTLCIPPRYQGKGYGKILLTFAKGFAEGNDCKGIRQDTWEHNVPAIALYQSSSFQPAGKVLSCLGGTEEQQILLHFEYKL